MRIAYVCADPGIPVFGQKGCSIHGQELIRGFRHQGAIVELFAVRWGGAAPADLADVKRHPLPPIPKGDPAAREQGALANNRAVQTALEQTSSFNLPFDLIYERYSLWSYSAMEFAQTRGIPGILEVNAPLITEQAEHRTLVHRSQAEAVADRVFGAATAIVAVSQEIKTYLSHWGIAHRVQVIPNGVNPQRFAAIRPTALAPGQLDTPSNSLPFTVGFVGSLKPWHGLRHLVSAFAQLHQRVPQARLLIVGDGPQRDILAADLKHRGLLPWVHCPGMVSPEQIPPLLASMDVAVAPYPATPNFYFSPLKVMEYLAAGRPVVASEIGQLAEVITHGETGWLCPPGDEGALAEALVHLWRTPALRQRLAEAGQRYILAHHTWDQVAAQILAMVPSRSEGPSWSDPPP